HPWGPAPLVPPACGPARPGAIINYNPYLIANGTRDLGGCSGMGRSGAGQDDGRRGRIAAQRAAQQRAQRRNRLLMAGGAIIVVVAVVLGFVLLRGSGGPASGSAS